MVSFQEISRSGIRSFRVCFWVVVFFSALLRLLFSSLLTHKRAKVTPAPPAATAVSAATVVITERWHGGTQAPSLLPNNRQGPLSPSRSGRGHAAGRAGGREDGRKGAGVIYPRCVIKWDLSIIGTIDPSGDCLLLRPVSPHYSCLGVVRWLLC